MMNIHVLAICVVCSVQPFPKLLALGSCVDVTVSVNVQFVGQSYCLGSMHSVLETSLCVQLSLPFSIHSTLTHGKSWGLGVWSTFTEFCGEKLYDEGILSYFLQNIALH